MSNNDLVITGIGAIGPFGIGREALRETVYGGRKCLTKLDEHYYKGWAAKVPPFKVQDHVRSTQAQRAPLISRLAITATALAIQDAELDTRTDYKDRLAVIYVTGHGPSITANQMQESIYQSGLGSVKPRLFQEGVYNAPVSLISIHYGIRSPVLVCSMGSASGPYGLKMVQDYMAREDIDCVVLVSADEMASVFGEGLEQFGLLSPNDGGEACMRPFDKRMNGRLTGEGGAALVIERRSSAEERSRRPYGRILGASSGMDGHDVGFDAPTGDGLRRAIRKTFKRTDCGPSDVVGLFSGAMANPHDDKLEAAVLSETFDGSGGIPPVTSTRPTLADAVGPAALFDTILALDALNEEKLPGVPDWEGPYEGCENVPMAVGPTAIRDGSAVMITAMAFHGNYSAALIGRA
ncbi:beta-ketoacyl synthase N-terminal-like domain-containing protein [Fodinicurvata sp. EGI_FJ10296]|uniref:beta-ketoacyl synthase N-terminal-like domain-containing protein n=1 Tax=Fodinicurvata sp. EGI_FJ10296 TaxID=3231908 RepID=UPI003453BEE1